MGFSKLATGLNHTSRTSIKLKIYGRQKADLYTKGPLPIFGSNIIQLFLYSKIKILSTEYLSCCSEREKNND